MSQVGRARLTSFSPKENTGTRSALYIVRGERHVGVRTYTPTGKDVPMLNCDLDEPEP